MIAVNPFVLRQTEESQFSHPSPPGIAGWDDLLKRVTQAKSEGRTRQGYREGVLLVDIPSEGIFAGVVRLESGAVLSGSFAPRRDGEDPRKSFWAKGSKKAPAKSAYAVLYASSVLAEDGSNVLPPIDGNWELISLNASPEEKDLPIAPDVLIHNHFGSTGGTATMMSDSEFVAALRESWAAWANYAMAAPK